MKYIIATFLSVMAYTAHAKNNCVTTSSTEQVLETVVINTDVPSHLKGATIIVKQADGRTSEVPAELFKVVPRKQQRIITKVQNDKLMSCTELTHHKNRVSALAGFGPREGLNKDIEPNKVDVESKVGVVGGLQYQRNITEKISLGVQGQTNKTGLAVIGFDF